MNFALHFHAAQSYKNSYRNLRNRHKVGHISFTKPSYPTTESPGKCFLCQKGSLMRAIKKVRLVIEQNPQEQTAQIFSRLILSLVEEVDFSVKELYLLDSPDFQLAMDILQEWRLDRYYMGKAKTFDMAQQALSLVKSKK
jgi:hypothetical protein